MTEHDMIAGTKRGDRRATEALLAAHLPMMRSLVRRWTSLVHLDDLLQRARLSVVRSAEIYDPSHGKSFARYAGRRVIADARRMARKWGGDVWEDRSDVPQWKRRPIVAERYEHHETLSPDDALGQYVSAAPTQEKPLCDRDIDAAIRRALPMLTPRQRTLVEHMLVQPEQTGEEVAAALSMGTRENVSQVRRDALAALRCHPAIRSIARDYGLLEAA